MFTWRGDAYDYRGPANYYRSAGGTTCTTSGGDTVPNAYNVRELVRLQPDRYVGGEVVELSGTKTITDSHGRHAVPAIPSHAGLPAPEPYSLTCQSRINRTRVNREP